MKRLFLLMATAFLSQSVFSQLLPRDLEVTWNVKEDNNKIIQIDYQLDRVDDSRYYKIIVRGFVDDRPLAMTSLDGDVGPSVRVGKSKVILWQWERDVTEISGELRFVVTQDFTAEALSVTRLEEVEPQAASLPLLGHPGIYLGVPAGVGLAITGLLGSSGAKSDWDTETLRTSENYNPLNKKYKSGQILTAAGGVVAIGGLIWYLVENTQFKKLNADSNMKLEPGFVNTGSPNSDKRSRDQVGIKFTYTF